MVSTSNRLYLRRTLRLRIARIVVFIFFLVSILDAWRIHSNIVNVELDKPKRVNRPKERIYIASMHFNDGLLLQEHWMNALLDLVDTLGKENVFVSIYESGSWDHTKWVLQNFDYTLWERGIARRIELGEDSHAGEVAKGSVEEEGFIRTPRGKWEPRRIPFLSKLRNKTIKDLVDLSKQGYHFDKVLFLNDVVFNTDDVLRLIDTNAGDYAAACSLDFAAPPIYYDTFALRDAEGYPHATLTWPYFRSSASRNALINHVDAVPVKSCWNGIVVMPAEPFVSSSEIKFRGISDSLAEQHVEGSECCLIHADNPLSQTLGVFLNPRVRVGYSTKAYKAVNPQDGNWVPMWRVFLGIWINRISRWTDFNFQHWIIERRFNAWDKQNTGSKEPGRFCLINEMQVIIAEGWAHV